MWGKTLRDGSPNMFGIRRHSNPAICPVRAIEVYVNVSSAFGVNLSSGFLLRPLSFQGAVINKQISTSAMQDRLLGHLQNAGLYEGETLHSFRAGATLTLALSGSQLADIMSHVGWRTAATASSYLKLAQVLRPGGPSELISATDAAIDSSAAEYADFNNLRNFVAAFLPVAN